MTRLRTKNGFEFSCDECGVVWEPPRLGIGSQSRDFMESWELTKEEGWRAFKNARDEWQHRCPDCRK